MKDEIKEILDILKKCKDYDDEVYLIKQHGAHLLLDYITNLQEENERLKEIVENLTTMTASGDGKQIKNTAQFKLDICKQRIDTAIEYIKKHYYEQINYGEYVVNANHLLNILQGKSDE